MESAAIESRIIYINSPEQQQRRAEAHGVDGTENERDQEEEDPPRLR